MTEQTAITQTTQPGFLGPVVAVKDALLAYQAKKDLIDGIMRNGVDYGAVPGTTKPTLLKAGAEKATSFFGLRPVFKDAGVVEDWTGEHHGGEPFFYYRRTCNLYRGDVLVASVDGSCNSWEKKYRYRDNQRVCPNCGKPTIIKGKAEYGGGFVCFAKKGGCGAKFTDNAPEITSQEVGQVKNPDIADVVNTILKMADKRALVAATLIATGLSEYFTQDVEDYIDGAVVEVTTTEQPAQSLGGFRQQQQPAMPAAKKNNKPNDNEIIWARTVTVKIGEQMVPLGDVQNMTDGKKRLVYLAENSKDPDKRRAAQILIDATLANTAARQQDYAEEGMADPRTGDGENK